MHTFDDTLPSPADVERAFLEYAGETLSAAKAWLEERGIDAAPVIERAGKIALLHYALVWNPMAGRCDFLVYPADHVGPKRSPALAVPILEDGKFVDLLLIRDFISGPEYDESTRDDRSYETACGRAHWLGRDNITGNVRLHAHPLDWLEAGCAGCCYIALIDRQGLKTLRGADSIVCNDVALAFDSWDWAFGSDEAELSRFAIDDAGESIVGYFNLHARLAARLVLREAGARL